LYYEVTKQATEISVQGMFGLYETEITHTLKIALIIPTYYYWSFDISKRLIKAGIFLVADIGVNGADQSLYNIPFSPSG
jgi:hypothetical protein